MLRFIAKFGRYNPQSYWTRRGKVFASENPYSLPEYTQQEREFVRYLKSIKFSSVLEVGCGYGRMSKLMLENFELQQYVGIDISPDLISEAAKLQGRFPYCRFESKMIQDFDSNERFDLVFCTEVMQHIPPGEIESVMNKLMLLSNHHVVNLDVYTKTVPPNLAKHNFIHDYERIYAKHPQISKVQLTAFTSFDHILFHGTKM